MLLYPTIIKKTTTKTSVKAAQTGVSKLGQTVISGCLGAEVPRHNSKFAERVWSVPKSVSIYVWRNQWAGTGASASSRFDPAATAETTRAGPGGGLRGMGNTDTLSLGTCGNQLITRFSQSHCVDDVSCSQVERGVQLVNVAPEEGFI